MRRVESPSTAMPGQKNWPHLEKVAHYRDDLENRVQWYGLRMTRGPHGPWKNRFLLEKGMDAPGGERGSRKGCKKKEGVGVT